MTYPFIALTKFIASLAAALASLFPLHCKSVATTSTGMPLTLVNYPLAEDSGATTRQPSRFIYGRVRRSAQRTIIEWQTKRAATTGNFAIYRGRTPAWREARPLDLSLFATADGQSALTTYRAVDTTAPSPGPYYYWIVDLTAKQGERRYGPYSSTTEEGER
ncbi:MAG: hypothetical protein DYG89_27315 [Caldilinea sp. CFX5]|nr:hypothetical protein [Caldilinea sp. CFX5]